MGERVAEEESVLKEGGAMTADKGQGQTPEQGRAPATATDYSDKAHLLKPQLGRSDLDLITLEGARSPPKSFVIILPLVAGIGRFLFEYDTGETLFVGGRDSIPHL